ncbi:MAG: glycoside hydrolase family 13 protein [Rhodothermaceae bacterium]
MKKILLITLILSSFCAFAQKSAPRVPEWAKEAVWYQIFPERFANGDKSNDPQPKDLEGGWPYFIPEGWQNHPWESDWYKQQPWEKKTDFDFYRNAGLRRYGGDLQGVIDKLDYLQDLGITAIYFNPVFESPSLHKYDATMYHHIDNNFGPDPAGDRKIWESENPADPSTWKWTSADKLFLNLLKEAHKRGMKVIIDGVFNHVGNTFWAFKDVIKNQDKSEYKDWFYIKKFDDPATPDVNEFDYEGWYGVKDLPEIKEDENGLIDAPAAHIKDIIKRWMDPNNDGDPSDGIDGWRLDVAEMVELGFWKKFRTWVKEINPNAYTTGEVWWEDWKVNKMFNAAPWLQGDAFDAVMNYRFARAVKNFVIDQKTKIDAQAFADTMKNVYRDYHPENHAVMMNLMGSHDTERLASLIVNPDFWLDHNANPAQRKEFDPAAPDAKGREIQRLVLAMQMTMPGAPMIYYGDEAGMWGGDDPDDRKPMVWPEIKYETETAHPFGLKRKTSEVKFNKNLFDWYKKLIAIRKSDKAFSLGSIDFVKTKGTLLVFTRNYKNSKYTIVVNSSDKEVKTSVGKGMKKELISGKKVDSGSLALLPHQMMILQ